MNRRSLAASESQAETINRYKRVLATGEKICCRCKRSLPVDCFQQCKRNKDGRKSRCAFCISATSKGDRNAYLIRVYGITQVEFTKLLASQACRCAICLSLRPGPHGWHVDHDHATNQVRGILCSLCNTGLGSFSDNPAILLAAAEYLRSRSATNQLSLPVAA